MHLYFFPEQGDTLLEEGIVLIDCFALVFEGSKVFSLVLG
jgi:hypothetical protein